MTSIKAHIRKTKPMAVSANLFAGTAFSLCEKKLIFVKIIYNRKICKMNFTNVNTEKHR